MSLSLESNDGMIGWAGNNSMSYTGTDIKDDDVTLMGNDVVDFIGCDFIDCIENEVFCNSTTDVGANKDNDVDIWKGSNDAEDVPSGCVLNDVMMTYLPEIRSSGPLTADGGTYRNRLVV